MGCHQGKTAPQNRMGCSHVLPAGQNKPQTLLEGNTGIQDDVAIKVLGQPRSSSPLDIDSVPGQEAITLNGFVPLLAPGAAIGSGSDARSVILHSAALGGAWITNGCQEAIVVALTSGHKPSARSKRWVVVARDDGYMKLVVLDVTSCTGQLYVQAVAGKHQHLKECEFGTLRHLPLRNPMDCLGTEANQSLSTMSAAPAVTSSTALGYGVQFLAYSQDDDVLQERIPDDIVPSQTSTNDNLNDDEYWAGHESNTDHDELDGLMHVSSPAGEKLLDTVTLFQGSGVDAAHTLKASREPYLGDKDQNKQLMKGRMESVQKPTSLGCC